MSARLLFTGLAAALAGCTAPQAASPTLPDRADGRALAKACEGRDGWSDPAPPARIHGNTYYVGTCGISAILIDTSQGLVLIDAATDKAAPSILENIRALGFDPKNIRYLLASHEHLDHVGGLAAIQQASGAPVYALAAAQASLTTGDMDRTDPQHGSFPPVKGATIKGIVEDGAMLPIKGLDLTVHATPAHTPGGTSWTWRSCEGNDCRTIAYVDSLSAVSSDSYRFTDHPDYVATMRKTIARVPSLPCDILLTPHPGASNVHARIAGNAPLVDTAACKTYADAATARLDARLAKEKADAP